MQRFKFIIVTFLSVLMLTACADYSDHTSIPALQNDNRTLLNKFVSESKKIDELYYEEAPIISHYSGGIKIESISKVWLKGGLLKTEQIALYYINTELIERQVLGELYNYNTLSRTRYYTGKYPEQIILSPKDNEYDIFIPREKTLLWYLDRIPPDISSISEGQYEGTKCLIVEFLQNSLGSTKVWISAKTGLPIRIVSFYNGITSERLYSNFSCGKDAVSDKDIQIPQDALIY